MAAFKYYDGTAWVELATAGSLSGYLPLTGGTLTGSTDTPLVIKGSNNTASYIGFKLSNGTTVGYLGVNSSNQPVFYSGSQKRLALYSELPTVNNGTLTIQKNGTTVATFTANQSGNATANITTPEIVDLT